MKSSKSNCRYYCRILTVMFATVISINSYLAAQGYIIGADLSFLKAAEDRGYQFKENNQVKAGLSIFHDHGYNWIRLRLFHTPASLPNNLEYTLELAREAKKMGYRFLLDYHYSDTWADPQKQFLPKAWEGLSHKLLVDSVYDYTVRTMNAFKTAGVYPDMVQVGNEIINGMLWPDGRLPENWDQFAELVEAGIRGVKASAGDMPIPEIMIHIDQGGNKERTKYFFNHLLSYGIDFDVIGQSYYPWWHGSLLDLRDNLYFMATEYKKPIILVEVAYCASPTEYIEKSGPFPETPEGQRDFLEAVNQIVLQTPDNLGEGIFWWEPAVGEQPGISSRDMFDPDGNILPAIYVFDKFTRY
jgi:arabinogalactan endo-1,4-beta-galactosidase